MAAAQQTTAPTIIALAAPTPEPVPRIANKNKDVNKKTNVTAYYLIKTELWLDLQNFLHYCMRKNKDIIKIMDTSTYFDYLKRLPKLSIKHMKVSNPYLKHTTRMTCLEIKLL